MVKNGENPVRSISDALGYIRMNRQSGLLSVWRIENGQLDDGEIYFQLGQPTFARAGFLAGEEAISWLLSWQQMRYKFTVGASFPVRNPNPTSPMMIPATPVVERETTSSAQAHWPTPPPNTPAIIPGERSTQPIELAEILHDRGIEARIPRKMREEENVMALPLTRPQRFVYMLVDGERTIADLARCVRKSPQEVYRLLTELQERDLISFSR